MADKRILNVSLPDSPPRDPLNNPLPAGIYIPQDLVQMEIETELDETMLNKHEDLDKAKSLEMPDEDYNTLYILSHQEGNGNLVFVNGDVRVLNLQPSSHTSEDYTILNAIKSGVIEAKPLPSSVDLRADWWTISDQGNSGACVGFGTADGVLRYLFTKTKALSPNERLASGALWIQAKETDEFIQYPTAFIQLEGTSLKAALNVAQRWGVVRESIAPFGDLYTKDAPTFYRLSAQMRISGFYNLGKNFNNWKQWLSSSGPILAAINVDSSFENATSTNGMLDNYDNNRIYGGHAICFVGYTQDNRVIIRNSWGKSWGDNGFAYASIDWIMKACLEAYGAVI